MQVGDVTADQPLDHTAQLLGGNLLERVGGNGRALRHLVRVAADQRAVGRLEDEFVLREIQLDLAFTTKRPDVADQERIAIGESQLRESDRFGAMLECSAQKRDRVGDTQPDESRSTTGALTPSWSATRVMAPRVIIA